MTLFATSVFVLFLVIIVINALLLYYIILYRKNTDHQPRQEYFYSGDDDDTWKFSKEFNETNYTTCANLIQYVYTLYSQSQTSVISSLDIAGTLASRFDLEDGKVHTALDNFLTYIGNSQYLIATTGRIRGTRTGVIAIRGTESPQEWKSNLLTIFSPIDLSKFQGKTGFSNISTLPGLTPQDFLPETMVAYGWYNLYCRQGSETINSCFCDKTDPFERSKCFTLEKNYSQIDATCKTSIDVIDPRKKFVSLASSLLQAITQLNVDNVIITGHSLGGALATLCAFHLSLHFGPSFIHSVYTFAAPEVGYKGFLTLYEKNVSPHYRVNNSKDIVGLLTSQLIQQEHDQYFKFLGKEYLFRNSHLLLFRPVGIEKTFTITDGSDSGWGEGDYHNLQKDYIDQGVKYLF